MAIYGVTEAGFNRQTFDLLRQEIIDAHKATLPGGSALNTSATSVYTNLNTPILLKIAELWEALEAVYSANDPDFATGEALDRLGLLTGTARRDPIKSTVTATVNLDDGTTILAGNLIASVEGNSAARFVSTQDVSNTSGITDDFEVQMEAETAGPTTANSGSLNVIESAVVGLNSITNALDAEPGSFLESDADYRLRRLLDLRGLGTGPIDAIRADLLNVDDVEQVFLFENTTDSTDVNGLPPHSFEALVLGGLAQDVVDQIWASKPAGIATYGSSSATTVDSSGTTQTIYYSRPAEKLIFVQVVVEVNEDEYPIDGDDQIKANIVSYADEHFGVGDDVIVSALYGPVFDVSGVDDVVSLQVYDALSTGSEVLSETGFTSHANWHPTGDFTDSTGAAVYTDSTGAGTLTQLSANFAAGAMGHRWYAFVYTITASTGDVSASVNTAFALTDTALDLSDGTHTTYLRTKATPGNFAISATSTTGGFTIDNVSLKIVNQVSGNYVIGPREIAVFDTSRVGVVTS